MSRFFINRPIFAAVLSILIILAGLVCIGVLPIAQYPTITPPTVTVTATYPGANAQTIAETVATPIEEQVNGVENMIYMSSTSSSLGTYTLTITFEVGTDIDMATVLVQNRVSIASNSLPEEVKRLGITTEKKSTNIVMFISIKSSDPNIDGLFLSNYAKLNITDELKRIPGVGQVDLFGSDDYSMRIWLDPDKLQIRGLTPSDVSTALQEQNMQVTSGKIGEEPTANEQIYQYSLDVTGRLQTEEEFKNIVVKALPDGQYLRIKDVATIELGSKNYYTESSLKDKPVAAISIYQLPGANALNVAQGVEAKMHELSKFFPKGVEWEVTLDTTKFVSKSIEEVYHTLFEAIILVLIVIMLFLQDWRAVLIPAATIPVSLIGTFAVMQLLGFSINTLTLFGIILAIGIVVDDAIIVVENTFKHLEEGVPSVREATIKAMDEVSGALIGVVLVMLAVFIPTAFIGGITGELYKQFALTIAVATVLSGFNALTLSPALCVLILKPHQESKFFVFKYFNNYFDKLTSGYSWIVKGSLRKMAMTMVIFLALSAAAIFGFMTWPTSFVPNEDQGYLIASVDLPDGSSTNQTRLTLKEVGAIIDSIPEIQTYLLINGYSMMEQAAMTNAGSVFVILKDWDLRKGKNQSAAAISRIINEKAASIDNADVMAFSPPAITGLGQSSGFEFILQDRSRYGNVELQKMADETVFDGNNQSGLMYLRTGIRASIPQLYLDIDREKVKMLQLSLNDVFKTLSIYLGSQYVNDFIKYGKIYQVKLQAGTNDRSDPKDILKISVRNSDGDMVPFSAFTTLRTQLGSELIYRYNMYPAAMISGMGAVGKSSGEAIQIMESMADQKYGTSWGYEWTSMAFQEKQAGSTTIIILALALIIVYLVLAAQYESFTSPAAVIMGVPIALLGVIIGCVIMKQPISVYTQIGIVLLIALSAKNAILIVEFARDYRKSGKSIFESALEAGTRRFRPILMTSFAFILGVMPLVTATGAGSSSRVSLGIAVFAGMIASALLGTIFIPSFYQLWQRIQERKKSKKDKEN